jgi:hypothetical protein
MFDAANVTHRTIRNNHLIVYHISHNRDISQVMVTDIRVSTINPPQHHMYHRSLLWHLQYKSAEVVAVVAVDQLDHRDHLAAMDETEMMVHRDRMELQAVMQYKVN